MSLLNCTEQLDKFDSREFCPNIYSDRFLQQSNIEGGNIVGKDSKILVKSRPYEDQNKNGWIKTACDVRAEIGVGSDTFCLSSKEDSSSSCALEACSRASASINSAVGDRQTLAVASQLFLQLQLNDRTEQLIPAVVDGIKQKEYENFYQQQVESEGSKPSLPSKLRNTNTSYFQDPALVAQYNFERISNCGNQHFYDKGGCRDMPSDLVLSNRLLNVNNAPNCHLGNTPLVSALGDAHLRRQALCSVSSDPEVYTKSPSVDKLNTQIQKLRDDMLALRTTTLSYKQYMERLFDELRTIAVMHDNSAAPYEEDSALLRLATDQQFCVSRSQFGQRSSANRDHLQDYDQTEHEIRNKLAYDELHAAASTAISGRDPLSSHALLPSYEDVVEARLSPNTKPVVPQQESSPMRKGKMCERPYSDPFVTCAGQQEDIYSDPCHPKTTQKYSVKSANSSLETESKKARDKIEQLRAFAAISKPNSSLHISECSIDSGYQGSYITSPKDKLGRDHGSQVVSPALYSDLPLVSVTTKVATNRLGKSNLSTRQNDGTDPCTNNDSSKMIEHAKVAVVQRLLNPSNDLYHPAIPNKDKMYENGGAIPPTHPAKLKCIEENHCFIDNRNFNQNETLSSPSHVSSTSGVVIPTSRPVPKQRTVFATVQNETTFSTPAARPKDLNIPTLKSTNLEAENNTNSCNSKLSNSEANATKNNSDTPLSNRSFPSQCLTFIKPSPVQTPVDTGSPFQSRVKLGVSAIKQLTPSNEKRDGPSFYCPPSPMTQQANDANSRMQKTANTKQMLREKYAAEVERSSNAAAAIKSKTEEPAQESEWSMVRRRSMRMMTEFQICDSKDGDNAAKSSKSAAHRRHGGRMIAMQKQKQKPSSNNITIKQQERPSNTYSMSPSAARMSKQVFETESDKPSTSKMNTKSSVQNLKKDGPAMYAGEPLPPPPPSPPRTPSDMEDGVSIPCSFTASDRNPISSADRSLKDAEIRTKQPVFIAPLIRPNASHPSPISEDHSARSANFKGLKLSPNSRSAFKPVATISTQDNSIQAASSGNMPAQVPLQSHESIPAEPQRRLSLPPTALSNKQRFLNEFMPDAANRYNNEPQPRNEPEPVTAFQRHSSWRKPRRNPDLLQPLVSAERIPAISNNNNHPVDQPDKKEPATISAGTSAGFATTEPLFCELPKNDPSSRHNDKRRRHASGSKLKTSSNHHTNLENQPIRFDKSDKITDVIGALKTAGYLRSTDLAQSYSKIPQSSSVGKNKKLLKEDNSNSAPAPHSGRIHQPTEAKGHIQTCYKARSSTSLHQYETVKLMDDVRDHSSNKLKNRKHGSKDMLADDSAKPRSHKSTIAMIRASLLGKRDKTPRSATKDGRRDLAVSGQKVRSSSVGDKLKVNDEFVFEARPLKLKTKEGKSKKHKTESKTKEKSSNKNNSKDQKKEKGKFASPTTDEHFVFPETSCAGYGNADAEVMERFLAAAAAAASNTPRSPLQRLRSSFRTPKHKNRLQETRIRDDIDVITKNNYQVDIEIRNKSNVHNGQEFTYV